MLSPRFWALLGPLVLLGLSGCRVAQPAYFSPAQPAYVPSVPASPDKVTMAPTSDRLVASAPSLEQTDTQHSVVETKQKGTVQHNPAAYKPVSTNLLTLTNSPARHANPDIAVPRRAAWLHSSRLMAGSQTSYTANQIIPGELPAKRRVPKGVFYAFAGSALPYGLFLFTPLAPWVWLVSLTLPLASMLVATGSLAKIRRNKTQFRGRGWAALALLLATSYVGMALVTLAALATSGILWE